MVWKRADMTSGGARARSGPKPDPNALRRDRKGDADVTVLPAEGRTGDAPAWPLDGLSGREAELWEREWRRPQAIMWERNGAALEVALYVRRLVEAEQPGAPTNLGTLVKQMMESLGITHDGLAKRHWLIAVDEVAERREVPAEAKGKSARDRLKVISGG